MKPRPCSFGGSLVPELEGADILGYQTHELRKLGSEHLNLHSTRMRTSAGPRLELERGMELVVVRTSSSCNTDLSYTLSKVWIGERS